MRTYEVVMIFRVEDEPYKKGLEFAKNELMNFGGNLVKEEDMGERQLGYPIKRQERGHYHLLVVDFPQEKIVEIDKVFKLQSEILKFLFVKQE